MSLSPLAIPFFSCISSSKLSKRNYFLFKAKDRFSHLILISSVKFSMSGKVVLLLIRVFLTGKNLFPSVINLIRLLFMFFRLMFVGFPRQMARSSSSYFFV
jgi:hypothetical protein